MKREHYKGAYYKGVYLLSQTDINRLQEMLNNEIHKRIVEGAVDCLEMRQRATVSVPMKVREGNLFDGLYCSVDTVDAIKEGIL